MTISDRILRYVDVTLLLAFLVPVAAGGQEPTDAGARPDNLSQPEGIETAPLGTLAGTRHRHVEQVNSF